MLFLRHDRRTSAGIDFWCAVSGLESEALAEGLFCLAKNAPFLPGPNPGEAKGNRSLVETGELEWRLHQTGAVGFGGIVYFDDAFVPRGAGLFHVRESVRVSHPPQVSFILNTP